MEQPQFDSLYKELTPAIQVLEEKRIELKAKGTKDGIMFGGIVFVIGFVILFFLQSNLIGVAIVAVISLFILFSVIHSQSAELSAFYKSDIIARVINSFCENATFNPNGGIREETFISSGLFSASPDRYHTEDLITGCIDKTDFNCAEVYAEEKHVTCDSKGNRQEHWTDIFKGFFFIADFHKDFSGETTIYRDSLFKLHFNGKRVKLENVDFEKHFDVYATNQVEARYLLSPLMMERLVELDKKFDGDITVSFRNSKVIIAIPDSANHFEASIWKSLLNPELLAKEFSTIHSLIAIVNDLNLNTRIWTKE